MEDYCDSESNWLSYLILVIFDTLIVINIVVKIWQVSLEIKYDVWYGEVETLSNEYTQKYYSIEEAMDSYCIRLESIFNSAKKIVTQNYIIILAEMVLSALILIPTALMYMVFRRNKEIAHFYSNRMTSIIINIEIAVFILTCFMDIKGGIEIVKQYQQISELVKEMFKGLDTILDTINFQINQYK